jgi:hypothetical protein
MIVALLLAATVVLPAPATQPPASPVPLFLDDTSGARAPAACVKAVLPRLRDQLSRDARVRLVDGREEATVTVDVRECGSRWETKTGGEAGVTVATGGRGSTPTAGGRPTGTSTDVAVGVGRQLSGYVILRARSLDHAPEFTSLPHTDVFADAVSVTTGLLLEWIGEHADELQRPGEAPAPR